MCVTERTPQAAHWHVPRTAMRARAVHKRRSQRRPLSTATHKRCEGLYTDVHAEALQSLVGSRVLKCGSLVQRALQVGVVSEILRPFGVACLPK